MMQREARDCGIETSVFIKVFNPAAAEDTTVGGLRIDCHHVIAGTLQRASQPTIPAPYLEDASGRCGQLRAHPLVKPTPRKDVRVATRHPAIIERPPIPKILSPAPSKIVVYSAESPATSFQQGGNDSCPRRSN